MNGDPLLSCRIKVDRAIKHFNDLTDAIKPFAARETYRIWADEDSEPAVKIYRVRIVEDMPTQWSGHIAVTSSTICEALSTVSQRNLSLNSVLELATRCCEKPISQ